MITKLSLHHLKLSMKPYLTFMLVLFHLKFLYADKILTWEDIVYIAKQNNPELKIAEEIVLKSKEYYNQGYSNFYPQITLSAQTSKSGGEDEPLLSNYQYGISGKLTLFSGFQDLYYLETKRIDLDITYLKASRTLSDIMYKLKKSFLNVLSAQDSLELTKQILQRRIQNYELVKLKYEAGIEDLGSLLRTEADKIQSEFEYRSAERNLKNSISNLIRDMGQEKDTNYELFKISGTYSIQLSTEIPNFKSLILDIPEYKIAELTFKKSIIETKIAKSSLYPSLSISGSTTKSAKTWDTGKTGWNIGAYLIYPIFSGGKDLYNIKIAQKESNIQELSFIQTQNNLMALLETTYNSMQDSIENLNVLEKYLNASKIQADITNQKYINGLTSYQDWYMIENDFINIQKSIIKAKMDAAMSKITWENILGIE